MIRAWNSDSGYAYCTPVRGNYIYVYGDGKWKREVFSSKDEDIFHIWGWPGVSQDSDTVFVSTDGALFIRTGGGWHAHRPHELAQRFYGIHGRHVQQLYVCGNKILLTWNGTHFEEADDPKDMVVKSILVRENDILGGENDLRRWT